MYTLGMSVKIIYLNLINYQYLHNDPEHHKFHCNIGWKLDKSFQGYGKTSTFNKVNYFIEVAN